MSQSGPSSLKRLFGKKINEEKVEEEILSMVEEGHEQGLIEESEAEMITNIMELSDKNARDIMTNRQKIIAMEDTLTVEDAIRFIIDNNYSRYPVYHEDMDNILGVVHLKDLVEVYMKNPEANITEVMEEPIFIHPTFNINKLLTKMQSEKIHMSVVVDEYGQTDGIVCMEDIIEEIVGNIFDEHDDEEEESIKEIAKDVYMMAGDTSLLDVSDKLDMEFPDEDFETLNGFMLYKLGRLPEDDETTEIIYQGYKFVPVKICDKMITLVKVEKIDEEINEDKE